MQSHDGDRPVAVVAVAASAGGVEALSGFVASLPVDFPATVLVVLHIPPTGPSVLPGILSRAGKLPAHHPADGERLVAGVIIAAPPDRHLAVVDDRVELLTGPRENGHRPSADTLLRSAAETFRSRAAGVVLSGTMDDGAAGLRAIRAVGGLALVQDPTEAPFPGMPEAAIDEAYPGEVCPVSEMGDRLCAWLSRLEEDPPEEHVSNENLQALYSDGDLTPFTCPECGGTLSTHDDYGVQRFRCRVGHSFSTDGLLLGKQAALEAAVWAAIVALEEKADLTRRVMKRLERAGREAQLQRYRDELATTQRRAEFLKGTIHDLVHGSAEAYDERTGGVGTAS